MKMRRMIFSATVALMLFASLTPIALAQDPNRLAQLKISVWPEYDKTTVLVMLDGLFADKTTLPREVSVWIPTAANLTVTTWENADQSLAPEQANTTTDAGDGYTRVTFTTSQPNYHVEYYHDALKGAPDKTLDFAIKSFSAVDQVALEIQQPLKASNFTVMPPTTNTRNGADGFKYFNYTFANVTAGQVIAAQARYTKTDPNPSVQGAPAPVATLPSFQPTTTATPSGSIDNLMLLAGLVSLGLVGILGFFFYQQRARNQEDTAAQKLSPRQFQRQRRRARGTETPTAFCTKCGSPLDDDDNFCPKCGAKRRVV